MRTNQRKRDELGRYTSRIYVSCDQCEILSIQGVTCHETGCPNSGKTWEDGGWVRYRECWNCGCDVREGETCNCADMGELDEVLCELCGAEKPKGAPCPCCRGTGRQYLPTLDLLEPGEGYPKDEG